jgi:hypothetical protein
MKKVFLIIVIFVAVMCSGIYAAYKYSIVQIQPAPLLEPTPVISLTATTPIPSPTKIASDSGDISAISPLHPGTVSFARDNGKVIMKYRGKIYDDTNQTQPVEITVKDSDKFQWYGLVDAPDFVKPGAFMYDEFFGFKPSPDGKKIIFIMRWGKENDEVHYYTYLYDPAHKNAPVSLIKKFIPDDKIYNIPKIYSFSEDSAYISLNMHSCWNCGGNKPETLLVKLSDFAMNRIGKTIDFTWKTDGAYTYKEYIVKKTCDEPGPVECFEDPKSLPEKIGTFKAD